MKYKATTIAPAGRNKYGNYMSKGNVTKSVVMTTYAGNDTTTTIGGGNKDEDTGTTTFYAMFSITNISFSALDLIDNATAETQVIAYQGYDKAVTLVCDMNAVSATLRTDGSIESLQVPANSGITGIPNGMQIAIVNNGTNNAKIQVSANNTIPDNGIMNIPVCVYKRADDIPIADLYNWYDHAYQRDENDVYYSTNNCEVVWLELAWNVNRAATSNYQMDLSNERAGVNVSATTSQGDVLYPNSIASLVCTASTHMNGELVTGITYRISQLSLTNFNARGVAIVNEDNVGKLVFTTAGTNTFNFTGPTLPLDIVAALDGEDIATKTMTIDKNYPSADGQAAVTKWIVSDHDVIHYNPNTKDINPMVINAWVMRQVGDYEPIKDSATTIYYSYNGATPTQTLPFDNDYIVSAKTYYTGNTGNIPVSALTFALKNNGGVVYESEEILCMWDGLNGADGASGATGASGKNGTDGVDGQSAWYLTLDNDNASVNANASGRIYDQAIKPVCHGRLYYGSQPVITAKYKVDWGTASGITSAVSSNGVLTIDTDHSGFNFTDDILSISVSGYSGSTSTEVRDVKIMNITKSKAGAAGTNGETPYISGGTWWIGGVDTGISAEGENGCTPEIIDGYWWICGVNTGVKAEGTDAVSYWLSLDYTSVIFNRNNSGYSPSSITATAYRQVGEDPFTPSPDTYITIKYRKRGTGTWTGTTSSDTASITAKKCVDNDRIRFTLYKGTSQLDQEDVDILCDGMDGKNGENGAQGRQGPAIRGPFDYYEVSSSTQCWCAGESGSSCEECDRWIDIVLKDGKFYMCNKTYTGKCATNYASGIGNTTYWVESDNFDFVATRVLLASAASINFLTNNWLYLRDENGEITAGARGGSGITYWAGSEDPEDAPFKVYNNGEMVATKGTFGCFTIGDDEYNNSSLVGIETKNDGVEAQTFEAHINPHNLNFSGIYSGSGYTNQYSVSISPDENYQDNNGALITAKFETITSGKCGNIGPDYVDNVGFETNGNVRANKFKGNVKTPRISAGPQLGTAVMSLYPSEIVYTTSDVTIFTKEGHWFVGGTIDTGISTAEDKSLFFKTGSTWYYDGRPLTFDGVCISGGTTGSVVSGAVEGMVQWHFNGMPLNLWVSSGSTSVPVPVTGRTNANKWQNGYWELPTGYIDDFQISGIGHPDYLTKRNNTIYIEV